MSAAVKEEVNFDAPTPKKSKKKTAKKVVVSTKREAPFPGLTRTACADACSIKGCSISGNIRCAHPTKGGLSPDLMNDPTALKRMQAARDQIDVRLDPDRFK